jgi:hypothetical protein
MFNYLVKLPWRALLRFYTMEQLCEAENLNKLSNLSQNAQALGMQEAFSSYHENTCVAE